MNWEPFPMSLTDASLGKIVCNFWNVMDHYYLDKPSPDQEGKQRKYEDGQTTSIRFEQLMSIKDMFNFIKIKENILKQWNTLITLCTHMYTIKMSAYVHQKTCTRIFTLVKN